MKYDLTVEIPPLTQSHLEDALWLEDTYCTTALNWVNAQTLRTVEQFCQSDEFSRIKELVLSELSCDSRVPWVSRHGDHFYNFWQDANNPKGVWRRTTLSGYREDAPPWEMVLDLDDLSWEEGCEWVFAGITPLIINPRYCLIHLSRAGTDARTIREFDLRDKRFIDDGFVLPMSKSKVSWINRDSLYVADAIGEGAVSSSGYPRRVKRWMRGTSLDTSPTIFEGSIDDVGVFAYRDHTPGFERDLLIRNIDANRRHLFFLAEDGSFRRVAVPEDAQFLIFRDWLLIKTSSQWSYGQTTYPPGVLLATKFTSFIEDDCTLTTLFVPDARTALQSFQGVGPHLLLSILDNVVNRMEVLTPGEGKWERSDLHSSAGGFNALGVTALDLISSDYFLTITGFLRPPSLYFGNLDGERDLELLKQANTASSLQNYRVSQHFATSKDGTQIPYFEISSIDRVLNGQNPTLLYGYGGFNVSLFPSYLGEDVPAWLGRGGVYVVANIRGGAEFGPDWHQAAIRQNRHLAFEDFAAVAQSLIERGVTVPAKLGARGASNGGLLTGNMLIRYPQLFGCIVCEMPLLDMQRYTKLLAGASWIAEYGDPEVPEDWAYMRSFSPYHNIRSGVVYPPVLFLTSSNDDRVSPAHARKMVFRMQEEGHRQVYLFEDIEGGHGAAVSQESSAYRSALVSEFLWRSLHSKVTTLSTLGSV
ncbi:prolyl oligopeptidase family protein [Pseudomonas asplenii]|uniref:prolyl oligopeptidase family serine peptidase n=1 Tax=Pseudomonas asplenii TaxID=53407 RepID=UPI0037C9B3D0